MSKHIIIILCLLLAGLIPAAAQEVPQQQEWIQGMVERISVDVDASVPGKPALVIDGTLKNSCEPLDRTEVHRVGAALFVDLYRTLNPAIRCLAAETPFEIVVPVPELLTPDDAMTLPQYLVVNDLYFYISIAQIEQPAPLPPIMFLPMKRADLPVDSVTIDTQDGVYALTVDGHLPGGCMDTPLVRARQDLQNSSLYVIDAYQLLDPATVCPLATVSTPFEQVLTTAQPASQSIIVSAGGKDYAVMTDAEQPAAPLPEGSFPSPHAITDVSVQILKSNPPQYVVQVSGYQPDGCNYPVQIEAARQGSTISIQIFRIMPAAVACPMMVMEYHADIRLEGTFAPGTYSVDVNGTIETFQAG